MSLPLTIATTSLVHYIAHFRANNDEARLQGLLAGSRRFLLNVTVLGTLLAILISGPLSQFFEFPRRSLMLAALGCVLLGLWSGFAIALCQGMAWFKRMAFVGLAVVVMRLAFGWFVTKKFSTAEAAITATTFSMLANFALLYWWKDLFKKGEFISPWNREFLSYLAVAAACVGGNYFFAQGDLLVAQKHLHGKELGDYTAAGVLGRALISLVGPMLVVLFTSRSGNKGGSAFSDQKIMLLLYAVGLLCGALGLIVLRNYLVRFIFGQYTPEAADMVTKFSIAMVFIGLVQAIATWCLASRWYGLAFLYGGLGVVYWVALLFFGHTAGSLLRLMAMGSGVAFLVMLIGWIVSQRTSSAAKA